MSHAYTSPGSQPIELTLFSGQCTCLAGDHEDKDAPAAFFQDIIHVVQEAGDAHVADDAVMPWVMDRCQFHLHASTARCDGRL